MGIGNNDSFDALLKKASASAMAGDIREFETSTGEGISEEGDGKIRAIIESRGSVVNTLRQRRDERIIRPRIPTRRRILVAILAAALTATLALAGIASRTANSARPVYELSDGAVTLTFDTSGLSPDKNAEFIASERLSENVVILSETSENGEITVIGKSDGENERFRLVVRHLTKGDSTVIDGAEAVLEIKLGDGLSGVAVRTKDGSAVVFNDGEFLYEMRTDGSVEEAIKTAQGLIG